MAIRHLKGVCASGFKSIWLRWIKLAVKETALDQRFTERSIRTFVGSQFDTVEAAARLLAHADTKKVLPMTKK